MNPRLLVIAKEPVPGRVKTRLCPPCTPVQSAAVARAALDDTLSTVDSTPAGGRSLIISGCYPAPTGWDVRPQRGDGLGARLANAFIDAARGPALLIGMDTPQVTASALADVGGLLDGADAVVAPAFDGGWWALALREAGDAGVLRDVPMSTSSTGRLTIDVLRGRGLRVAIGPAMRDVDTAQDAWAVAHACPAGRFAAAVRAHVPSGVPV